MYTLTVLENGEWIELVSRKTLHECMDMKADYMAEFDDPEEMYKIIKAS